MKTVAALSTLAAVVAAGAPPPGGVQIKSVGYAGTGCPQGSAYAQISDDKTTMTVAFDSYVATVGGGASPRDQRKACTLNLEVLYPSGYQFSIFTVRTQGYINTDAGVTGQVRNSYFFSGQPGVASSTTNIPGNTHGSWAKSDAVNNYSSVLSPCGGDGVVNIQTSIALQQNQAGAQGYISTDSIDAGFKQKFRQDYGLDWVPCGGGAPQGLDPNYQPPSDDSYGSGPAPAPAPAPYSPPAPAPYSPPTPAPFTPPTPSPFNPPVGSSPFGGSPYNPFNPSPFNPFLPGGISGPVTAPGGISGPVYGPGGISGPVYGPGGISGPVSPASPWTTVTTTTNGWPY